MPTDPSPRRPWYDRPLALGSVGGIPLAVSTSWVIITVVMVALFAPRIREWVPGTSWLSACAVALGYTLLLALSVLIHELGHAIMAKAFGWTGSTIEITLWGGHTTFREVEATPGRSLLVSVVGPALNLLIAGVVFLVQALWPTTGIVAGLITMAAWSNLLLGCFNLLPGLPLDGGRLVESLAWKITGSRAKGIIAAGWAGRIIAVLGLLVVVLSWVRGPFVLPLLPIVIAVAVLLPLYTGASTTLEHGRLRRKIEALDLSAVASPVTYLPSGASVAHAIESGVLSGTVVLAYAPDPGTGKETLLRVLPEAVEAVPVPLRAGTPVKRAAVSADDAVVLGTEAGGERIIAAVLDSVSSTVLIVDKRGRTVSAVQKEKVIAALQGGQDHQ